MPDETYYYIQDDLYNVVALTDDDGEVVERYTYADYGMPTVWVEDTQNPGTWIEHTSITGAPISSVGNPFMFTGRRWDAALELYDYRTRYYNPALGRFLRIDTIGLYGDPNNLGNPYAYVGNNPWSGTDPWGERSNSVFAAWRERRESDRELQQAFGGTAPEVGDAITREQIVAATRARRARQNDVRVQFRQEIRDVGGYEGDFYQDAADAQNLVLNEIQKNVALTAGAVGLAASGPTLTTAAAVADAGNAGLYAARDERGRAIVTGASAGLGLTAAAGMARSGHATKSALKFGQKSVKSTFAHGPFKGQSIGDVAKGLRSGRISPDQLPIEYVVRNGERVALNNRSLTAFRRAGMEPTRLIDRTGIAEYENLLTSHLRGSLPSDVIQIRGGAPGASLIE